MVQRTTTVLVDDLDGADAAETVAFALDGVTYDIDLSGANSQRLRDTLAPFLAVARRVGGRPRRTVQAPATTATTSSGDRVRTSGGKSRTLSHVRAWAVANGYSLSRSGRGRIPGEVLDAYDRAQQAAEAGHTGVRGRRSTAAKASTPADKPAKKKRAASPRFQSAGR